MRVVVWRGQGDDPVPLSRPRWFDLCDAEEEWMQSAEMLKAIPWRRRPDRRTIRALEPAPHSSPVHGST